MSGVSIGEREACHGDCVDLPAPLRGGDAPATLPAVRPFGEPSTFFLSIVWGWENAKVRVPMCRRHRHHWRNRQLFLLPVFLVGIALMGFCVAVEAIEGYVASHTMLNGRLPLVNLGGVLLFLVSVAFGLSGIQAKDVHESRVQLACISPEFIQAYEAQCAAEREQVEQTQKPE